MPGKPPVLDDRALKNILARLQQLAALHVSGWSPPQEGDAGTMLQRIFARLLEITLERLNKVPDKNLLAFLNTMGVSLLSPSPAKVPLTFSIASGSSATLVPQGTQAGAQPSGQEAVTFEMDDDLIVIPAQLVTGFTMDPTWDRYTDETSMLAGEDGTGFTPFVGIKRMPHVLYIGDDVLLDYSRVPEVQVHFDWSPGVSEDVQEFLRRLSYQYWTEDNLKTTIPIVSVHPEDASRILLRFNDISPADQSIIQGVGLAEGIESHWLQVVLNTPFPDSSVAQQLELENLILSVSDNGLLPDFAFSNTAPVDVTKDFYPFGETPKSGDAFYLGSQEAFSKPNAKVTLSVKVKPLPLTLVWEYWGDDEWIALPWGSFADGTSSLNISGTLRIRRPNDMYEWGEEEARWFRVRIAEGSYRGAPRVTGFRLSTILIQYANPHESEVWLVEPEFAQEYAVLEIEDEFVIVLENLSGGHYKVQPRFREGHEPGAEVRRWEMGRQVGQFVETADSKSFTASVTEEIAEGDVLLIEEGENYDNSEFVIVEDVELVSGNDEFRITASEEFFYSHSPDAILRRVDPYFMGYTGDEEEFTDGDPVDFTGSFFPFGSSPVQGNTFYFGAKTDFPPRIEIGVDVKMTPELQWEFLGANGWQSFPTLGDDGTPSVVDGTGNLFHDGDIVLSMQPVVMAEVNGQSSCWIRVRFFGGDYGRPIAFEPVKLLRVTGAPAIQGFQVVRGTGSYNPPVITDLKIGYKAERCPVSLVTQNGFLYNDQTSEDKSHNAFSPFTSVEALSPHKYADSEPAFYLGFDTACPEKPVSLYMAVAPRAISGRVMKQRGLESSSSSALPALLWEYFDGMTWKELTVIDGTNNLTESGVVKFLAPTDMEALAKFDENARYWIRARSSENDPYDTQQLLGVFLNTAPATQAETMENETLGSSNSEPDQEFQLSSSPVMPGQQIMVREQNAPSDMERRELEKEEGNDAIQEQTSDTGETEIWVRWHQVPNFLQSQTYSRHYTLDQSTGTITFGDGKRGLIPPGGTNNIVAQSYRTGGGASGNVSKGDVSEVKSALPSVKGVTNPVSADGGSAMETVPMVKERGPQTLRHRYKAVSCGDLEWLARQAVGTRIARAKCLPNINRDLRFEPGWTTLIIVPRSAESKPSPGSELICQVEDYLAEIAFVGMSEMVPGRINVVGPGYIQVTVETRVVPLDIDEVEQVKQRALTALDEFLHPLAGGPDVTGWEFGRDIYESEVCELIEDISGVSYMKGLRLIPNLAQHRLYLDSPLTISTNLTTGSAVRSDDGKKAGLLAESLRTGALVERVPVKGFKEGDRVAIVRDLTVSGTPVVGAPIAVDSFDGGNLGLPRYSPVMTLDGSIQTRLMVGIPPGKKGNDEIVFEDDNFASALQPGDVITLFYPFPMTVTWVTMGKDGSQMLGIDEYESVSPVPVEGNLIATLDNSVRLPLSAMTESDGKLNSLRLLGFTDGDGFLIPENDEIQVLTVRKVELAEDTVYLDDNFLVYPGDHIVTMVAE